MAVYTIHYPLFGLKKLFVLFVVSNKTLTGVNFGNITPTVTFATGFGIALNL